MNKTLLSILSLSCLIPTISFSTFYSQIGQDKRVAEILNYKEQGVFVDVGAHNGITYSNTYFLEKELGWTGMCIEPHPENFKLLRSNRSCSCINACASDSDGNTDFLKITNAHPSDGPDLLSGMLHKYDPRHLARIAQETHADGSHLEVINVPCLTLRTLCADHHITHIDYLSIDTEGSELEVLKGIDFESVDIDLIDVENNFGENIVRVYLESKGFVLYETLGFDQLFRNKKYVSYNITDALDTFAVRAYSTKETLYTTYTLTKKCLETAVEGDFVECGVAAGAQVAAMAYACQQAQVATRVHLFDSFEGIPLAGPHDAQQPGVGAVRHNVYVDDLRDLLLSSNLVYQELGNAAAYPLEKVQAHMREWGIAPDLLVYHKGWFQDVLPHDAQAIERIALLRIDADLYESTKICLEYLYPKISKGGYIILDDYALPGCRQAVEEYIQCHNLTPTIIPIEGGGGPVYWHIN